MRLIPRSKASTGLIDEPRPDTPFDLKRSETEDLSQEDKGRDSDKTASQPFFIGEVIAGNISERGMGCVWTCAHSFLRKRNAAVSEPLQEQGCQADLHPERKGGK
jgi:hypothetical protein